MIVVRHRQFRRNYQKRILSYPRLNKQFEKRLTLFILNPHNPHNPHNPQLRDHKLTGSLQNFRSFSITGDVRVVYRWVDEETLELYDIGTHNQVY